MDLDIDRNRLTSPRCSNIWPPSALTFPSAKWARYWGSVIDSFRKHSGFHSQEERYKREANRCGKWESSPPQAQMNFLTQKQAQKPTRFCRPLRFLDYVTRTDSTIPQEPYQFYRNQWIIQTSDSMILVERCHQKPPSSQTPGEDSNWNKLILSNTIRLLRSPSPRSPFARTYWF